MAWTRGRIAYDLIGHKYYLVDKALHRKAKLCKWFVVQPGLYVTATGATSYTYAHALTLELNSQGVLISYPPATSVPV